MTKDTLAMALSKVMFEYEPKLLDCDLKTSAKVAFEVANLLGCIMATVMVKSPDDYMEALRVVTKKIHEAAESVAARSLIDNTNITEH